MSDSSLILADNIQRHIYTIRGIQVMFDEELAKLYGVETKRLNEQVKRNIERFPAEFMFQPSEAELENLRSQFATSSWGGRRHSPYVFTEQGIAMLSAVLRSETAVKVSVQIMNAFVAMRRFLLSNAQVFQRLDSLELWQAQTDQKVERLLNAIEDQSVIPKQGIFYDGQVFDAYAFVADLIRAAGRRIILIDNYVDESVLLLLAKRKAGVSVQLLTRTISRELSQDIDKFNAQYPPIEAREFTLAHDRFLIIDDDIYHIGASLKDLGKKWFAFSRMEMGVMEMLGRVGL
ncbi:ORF6N domain-containing protein [Candidatus Symbiobacter mobilis]|uniref:DNA-binding domain protein n=1 Tax=Candidatus Symbiobacter mobilis CR TaxID=946483 RepID=U5NB01_9BURK|nr:ORF6N domain-containing protein [Candidatus Symbiobacter mobilis]AGX88490.1 DNA-binding domain protein [Candidatus Symbiobacter mobilis CR]